MIKNFIWDFDGTLFDTYPVLAHLLHKTFEKYGINESVDEIISYMKISMSYMYDKYSMKYLLSDQVFCEYEALADQYQREHLKPFKFAKIICKAIVNNSGHNFLFTHRGVSAVDYLKDADMESYFTECITSEYGFKRKPDPEAIIYLIEKYKLNPLETLFRKFDSSWINSTIMRLIINCFKEIVVSQTSLSNDTTNDCINFWNVFTKIAKRNYTNQDKPSGVRLE